MVTTLGSTPESELIGVVRTHHTPEVDQSFQKKTRKEFAQTAADSDGSVIVWVLPVPFLMQSDGHRAVPGVHTEVEACIKELNE